MVQKETGEIRDQKPYYMMGKSKIEMLEAQIRAEQAEIVTKRKERKLNLEQMLINKASNVTF